jgi:hypothetical protein
VLEYHTTKSVVTVHHAFGAKYTKDLPTDKTIRAWYKQFTETGCLCKQKSSGHPLTAEDDTEWVWASFLHMAKAPDITPCDFFLWGYVKDWVFVPPLPRDLADLKAWFIAAMKNSDAPMLMSVWQDL